MGSNMDYGNDLEALVAFENIYYAHDNTQEKKDMPHPIFTYTANLPTPLKTAHQVVGTNSTNIH